MGPCQHLRFKLTPSGFTFKPHQWRWEGDSDLIRYNVNGTLCCFPLLELCNGIADITTATSLISLANNSIINAERLPGPDHFQSIRLLK